MCKLELKMNDFVATFLCITMLLFPSHHLSVDAHMGHGEVHHPPLLVLSFDGFRYDYIDRPGANVSSFNRIKDEGVYARNGMKNVFVTNTIPNHWTLVTGLYPESHGVLNNDLVDPNIETDFIPKWRDEMHRNDPAYYDQGGEPIWVTNEIQSKQGRSGTVMWFGAENPVKHYRPSLHLPFKKSLPFKERIDTIIEWITLPEHPINLGLVYFHEPDDTGHKNGAESSQVTEAISNVNGIVAYLFEELEERDILDDINIVITSDHGMVDVSKQKTINLDAIVDSYLYRSYGSTVASIYPFEGEFSTVYEALHTASTRPDSHFTVYKRDDIPSRYHYKHNDRTPPILAVCDLHWSFGSAGSKETLHGIVNLNVKGNHGYDNDNPEMHPFFMAMGPSFRPGVSVESFHSVDVYPLLCHLLGIHPAPNNGSLDAVQNFLFDGQQEHHKTTMWTFSTYILMLIVIASVGGVFSVAACRQHRYLKRKSHQLRLPDSHQLRISPLQGSTVRYSTPPKGEASARLLSSEDDDAEFDDATDDEDDILQVVSHR